MQRTVYRYIGYTKRVTTSGEVRVYPCNSCHYYEPRVRRPGADEVAEICAEIAGGATRKATAAAHGLSTDRLRRLLKRYAAAADEKTNAGDAADEKTNAGAVPAAE